MTDFYKKNDNLLRDKLTQHEFAQTPNAWENMSALLDQHPVVAKRAVGYWWSVPFVAAATLAGVIGLGMYFAPKNTQTTTSNISIAEQAVESFIPEAPEISKQLTTLTTPEKELKQPLVESKQDNIVAIQTTSQKGMIQKRTKAKNILSTTSSTKHIETPVVLSPTNSSTPPNKVQDVENTSPTVVEGTDTKIQENKHKVKTTRTEIIYQYSTTPLRALQEKRKLMKEQNTIGNFGIGDELDIKKSPLKASVFGGASAKVYRSTKDLSVMPFVGVSASYRIAKHHGIQAGVQYKGIGNLTNNSTLNKIDPAPSRNGEQSIKRIDLLEVPLVYQFHPHPKYNLQAGVKGTWVMNTQTTNTALDNLSNTDMGISDFDFSLLLGFEYCLNEHWAVGLQYSLGLMNLTKDAVNMHEEEIQATKDAGADPQHNINSLDNHGELIVPVSSENSQKQSVKIPNQLHNNDVQLLLKYTF